MTLPGPVVISRNSPTSRTAPLDTGTAFFVGITDRGPSNAPLMIRSLAELSSKYGLRVNGMTLYDAVDVFFREGGAQCYIGRVVGPAPVKAAVTLQDAASASTATVTALSEGVWGNNVTVTVAAGGVGGTFTFTVKESGVTVEVSPDLADVAAAVAWASSFSNYIRVTDLGHADPAVGTFTLISGTDDHASATETQWLNALNLFTADYGPGQVAAPGRTTATIHANLLQHAQDKRRTALLDGVDTATATTLTAAAAADRALATARFGGMFAPWAVVPGIAPGTLRTVPYSAVEAGILARNDGAGLSPNTAAAGDKGQANYAVGLSQVAWSDSDREVLNNAGVNVARILYGGVRTYGFRTLIDPNVDRTWLQLTNSRLDMAIRSKAQAIAELFEFSEIDGKGKTFARFQGELVGMLLPFYSEGSLYGDTPEEAFNVDVGPGVNTPTTISNLEIHAVITLRMSPFGEVVIIEVAKVPITEAVA